MDLTIQLSEQNAAELEAQARAARMPIERYLGEILSRAIETRHNRAVEDLTAHLNSMASQVLSETTPAEMENALEEALSHVRPQRNWRS